jgi:hypothetical protein
VFLIALDFVLARCGPRTVTIQLDYFVAPLLAPTAGLFVTVFTMPGTANYLNTHLVINQSIP